DRAGRGPVTCLAWLRLPVTTSTVAEKLGVAAECIESGSGPIQGRHYNAMIRGLATLEPEHFQERADRELFAKIKYRVTDREAVDKEGFIVATIRQMTEHEAQEV